MLDPNNIPEVGPNELLVRFILTRKHFNQITREVRAEAFSPRPWVELSMNRQREASANETWALGRAIASKLEKQLRGLVNVPVSACLNAGLRVIAAPVEGNPNHVNVVGFPEAKQEQMLIAIKLRSGLSDLRVHSPPEDPQSPPVNEEE